MKTFTTLFITFCCTLFLVACENHENKGTIKIGIILPMEHKALEEIVTGFKDKFQQIHKEPVEIKVLNAQGDANLQRAIIQQMADQNYSLIVPVATGVTQMTASIVHDQPIVGLAAEFSEDDREELDPCNIAIVHDEIPPQQLIQFIHAAYPNLTKLSLIHSTSDKIFPDVQGSIAKGEELGIEVKPIMVSTLPELVSAIDSLPEKTQGIFILKDNLLANGISTLIKAARSKHIPLFTSDEGTVESGAGLALGVHERAIGEAGAAVAVRILAGKEACEIPIVEMTKLTLFINKKALEDEKQDLVPIEAAAKKLNYQIEYVGDK